MAVTVLLTYLSIFIMDEKFRMLVAANITSGVNCGLLGFKVFYSFFTAANFNIPAAFRIGYNMMSLCHNLIPFVTALTNGIDL